MVDQNQSPNESRALALSQPHADLPSEAEWAILQRMAKAFAESGLYPNIKNVAQAIAVVQTGRELGVPPSAALRTINIISGKPTQAAELMAALIYRDQGSDALRVIACTNERCVVRYKRREWEGYEEITFSMEDAERADLLVRRPDQKGKSNWEKYPRAMLRSRAISEAARTAFADSILGMYTAEEIAPERVTVTPEGEVVLEGADVPSRVVDGRTGEVLSAGPLLAEPVAAGAAQPAAPEGGIHGAPAAARDETTPPSGGGDVAAAASDGPEAAASSTAPQEARAPSPVAKTKDNDARFSQRAAGALAASGSRTEPPSQELAGLRAEVLRLLEDDSAALDLLEKKGTLPAAMDAAQLAKTRDWLRKRAARTLPLQGAGVAGARA